MAIAGERRILRNIGVRHGRVATVTAGRLDTTGADVIDATGAWVIPGIIDIRTHYGIEILCEPELSESLRRGVTGNGLDAAWNHSARFR